MSDLLAYLLSLTSGYKTYAAAIGLVGLAVYQFTAGQYDAAGQSLLLALTGFGLRQAIDTAAAK